MCLFAEGLSNASKSPSSISQASTAESRRAAAEVVPNGYLLFMRRPFRVGRAAHGRAECSA